MIDTDFLIKRSKACLLEGLFDQAIADLSRVIASGRSMPDAYITRALAYTEKIHAAFPDELIKDEAAMASRRTAFRDSMEMRNAIADIGKAIELDNTCSAAYFGKASIMVDIGDYPAAIAAYDKYLELVPDAACVHYQRANAYHKIGDSQKALADMATALNLSPEMHLAYYERAIIYRELQEYAKAMPDINRAIELSPERDYYLERALLIIQLAPEHDGDTGILKIAFNDLACAIALAPEEVDAYYLRAHVNLMLNQRQKELRDLTKTINLAPQEADAYKRRFHCNLACGHRWNAAADWLAYCQLDGNASIEAIMALKDAAMQNLNAVGWN